jgi:type IV pilus assembly protein PilM
LDIKKTIDNFVVTLKESLKFGKQSFVGLDLGQNSVKIAQVAPGNGKKLKLLKFGMAQLPEGAIVEDEVHNEEVIISTIKNLLTTSKTDAQICAIGLKGPNTFTKRLTLAGGTPQEIEDQVVWEAEQYIPFDMETATLGFDNMGVNEGGGVDVLVAAAKNDVVNRFKDLVEKTDLRVKIVDMDITAVINVFEVAGGQRLENPNESFMILEIGAQKTNFVIYKNRKVFFTKEIPIGGGAVTEEIQRKMGVKYVEAEDLKKSGDEKGNLPEEILKIIEEVLNNFLQEIQKTYDFYVSSTSDQSLAGCFTTGGGSQIPGIVEGLEAILGVAVSNLDVLSALDLDSKESKGWNLKDINHAGVVAIGLAMRGL